MEGDNDANDMTDSSSTNVSAQVITYDARMYVRFARDKF